MTQRNSTHATRNRQPHSLPQFWYVQAEVLMRKYNLGPIYRARLERIKAEAEAEILKQKRPDLTIWKIPHE